MNHQNHSASQNHPEARADGTYTCPMHPEIRQSEPGACPKCGMALEPVTVAAPKTRTQYTCPMHPQIIRDAPGSCPICGMALEPMTVTLDEEANPELTDMSRRFWIGTALTVPVVLLTMSESLFGNPLSNLMSTSLMPWIEFILATPVVLWCGWPLLKRGWDSLVNRSLNMFTLIALGVSVSYLYSLVAILQPNIFPANFLNEHGQVGRYFEVAAVITTLVLLGQVLELRARSQTSNAIKALLGLAPKTARLIRADGTEVDVPLEDVKAAHRSR